MNKLLSRVFIKNAQFPNRIFNKHFSSFLAFEPTLVQDLFFFEGLTAFLRESNQKEVIAGEILGRKKFLLDIGKLDYNYWIRSVFTIDELSYTEAGITSDSGDWGLYIDSVNFEIGLAGFLNDDKKQLFLNNYQKDDQLVFESLERYIYDLGTMLHFSEDTKSKYNKIIENHSTK